MLTSAHPRSRDGIDSNTTDFAASQYSPRTRVDSGHVVDGNGVIRRVPKLAVRNRTSDESNGTEQAIASNSDAATENERSAPVSSNSSQRVRTPLSARSLSDESVHERRQSPGQRQSGSSRAATQTAAKKKRAGMLTFLTLKEPSTSAWADFAEAEKAKAKQKDTNSMSSGPRSGSSQKLPDFVPKVNSRWDGLPERTQWKSSDSKPASRGNRNSLTSTATRDTTSTARSTASGSSQTTKRAVVTLSGKPVRDSKQSSAMSGRTGSSHSYGKQPPALALDVDSEPVTDLVENTDENRPQTFLRDPSPPARVHEMPTSPPELEGDDVQYFQELDGSAPHSPRTPPADGSETRPALVGIHYPELDSMAKEAELLGDTKMEAVVRANSSRRPVNFSRLQLKKAKQTPALATQNESKHGPSAIPDPLPTADGVLLSPTLKTPGGEIEPFLTDTFASHSRETGHIPQRVASTLLKSHNRETSDTEEVMVSPFSPQENPFHRSTIPEVTTRPPTASSIDTASETSETSPLESQSQISLVNSLAPSDLSDQWQMSPKERLGLGSRLRKSEVLPWEPEEFDFSRDRLSPSPGPESKVRRLSWRLSGKK